MPRALLVAPGPSFSVADVSNGWKKGLVAAGYDVMEFNTDTRVQFFAKVHLERHGEFIPALHPDDAVLMATEAIKGHLYDWWPDLVVVISGFFWTDFLSEIVQARGHKLVFVMTESPYQEQMQLERAQAGADLVVLNDPTHLDKYAAAGIPACYTPHSYDPDVHTPGPAVDAFRSEVCVVGTGYPSRVRTLEQINWAGIDLALCGMWRSMPLDHPLARKVRTPTGGIAIDEFADDDDPFEQCVDNRQTVDWYRSTRASINMYRKEADRPELSAGWAMGPREIELAATGTFFISEPRGENVERLPAVPKFESPGEAEELLRYALAHPEWADQIVAANREAIHGWTFTERVAEVCRLLDRQPVRA